jgi:hypothetical protein
MYVAVVAAAPAGCGKHIIRYTAAARNAFVFRFFFFSSRFFSFHRFPSLLEGGGLIG